MRLVVTFASTCVAFAGSGFAQPRGLLDIMVSRDGANWVNSLNASTSGGADRIHVGVFLGVQGAYGVAGAVFNVVANSVGANDTIDIASPGLGRQLPWTFGAASQAVFRNGNTARIDAANDPTDSVNRGISVYQRDPSSSGAGYSMANPALVYRFDVIVNSSQSYVINLQTAITQVKNGVFVYHSSSNATRGTNTTNIAVDGASIIVNVPSPGILSAFGVCGAAWAGRRRRAS